MGIAAGMGAHAFNNWCVCVCVSEGWGGGGGGVGGRGDIDGCGALTSSVFIIWSLYLVPYTDLGGRWLFRRLTSLLSNWLLANLQLNATGIHWWWIHIGSRGGLVLPDSKPLHAPMLTQIYVAYGGTIRPQFVR